MPAAPPSATSRRAAIDASGATNAPGIILWTNRCVGDYTVNLTVPAGYTPTMPIAVSATVTPA